MMTTEEWNGKPCGGTDQDLTPEAVERICQELLDTCKGQPAQIPWPHRPQHKAVATLRALSAALEAERGWRTVAESNGQMAESWQARSEAAQKDAEEWARKCAVADHRAEAAEAKLKEAVKRMEEIAHMGYDMPSTFVGTEGEWYSRRANLMQGIARAFLATLDQSA